MNGVEIKAHHFENEIGIYRHRYKEKGRIDIDVSCPKSNKLLRRRLKLNAFTNGVMPALNMTCPKMTTEIALLIYTERIGIAVEVDGSTIGMTDRDGLAHLSIESQADKDHQIRLNALPSTGLKPEFVEFNVKAQAVDELIVIDQSFSRIRGKSRKKKNKDLRPMQFKSL